MRCPLELVSESRGLTGAVRRIDRANQLQGVVRIDRAVRRCRNVLRAGLAVLTEWGISPDDERLNPNGSGISLGHTVGATGARILATLAYELHRTGGCHALEAMCIGGGQGLAAVFERVA